MLLHYFVKKKIDIDIYICKIINININININIIMSHQDWNTITFNNISNQIKKENSKKINSNKTSNPEKTHLEPPKDLGKLISQARTANNKNQKQLSNEIGISQQILARWESNREFPNNAEIAKLEKFLKTKLPRCRRVNNEE